MTISVELPDTVMFRFDPGYVKQAIVALLYHLGNVSEKEACAILGLTRRAFEDLLPQFGMSVLADTPENIEHELNA